MNKRITATEYRYLELTVMHVFRANFNDSYYHETIYIDLNDFNGDEPLWIDPYNGRSKTNETLISVEYCSDKEYVILEKNKDTVKASERRAISSLYICCEDYDSSMLLASHINFRKNKR